ncbi:MAG: hypothetical protein PSV35_08790, partial [bacterium]|nr:hypothetical protein [bacterium]
VLGLHEIDHIAVTQVNSHNQLVTFSSTPALEFNLFSSHLWRYDRAYNPQWFQLCSQEYWQNLYNHDRYDELYYLKQIKHGFSLGLSLAAQLNDTYVIYSLATQKSSSHTREVFASHQEEFYKIGQYCSNMLIPLFSHCDALLSPSQATRFNHEISI